MAIIDDVPGASHRRGHVARGDAGSAEGQKQFPSFLFLAAIHYGVFNV